MSLIESLGEPHHRPDQGLKQYVRGHDPYADKKGPIGCQDVPPKQALRYNTGKLQWSMVDFKSLEPMVKVLEFGAQKYDRDNWKKGFDRRQVLESMMRHLTSLMDGEDIDNESGISHMGHIQCNAMFFNYHERNDTWIS